MLTFNPSSQNGKGLIDQDRPDRAPIGELADNRLRRNGYLALENVRCDYRDGVLRLSGHVPTYYLKQIAQETVADVEGVQVIENDVEVLPARPSRNRCGRVPR